METRQVEHETEGTLLLVPELKERSCDGCALQREVTICAKTDVYQCTPNKTIAIRITELDEYLVKATTAKLTGETS